jgi:hypothetical protein
MNKIRLSYIERKLVLALNDDVYTVDFLEEWLNNTDTVFENPVAAMQCATAEGFYCAIKGMTKLFKLDDIKKI